jgi:hypothetical protein
MAAKPKHNPTWIATIDGNTPTEVVAEKLEVTDTGALLFYTEQVIVRAVAVGHWTTVELKPEPEPAPA